MVALGYRLIFILSSADGPVLPGRPLRLRVSYQACMETPLPEAHPPGYTHPDLPGPAYTQRIREDDVGKDEEALGFSGLPE